VNSHDPAVLCVLTLEFANSDCFANVRPFVTKRPGDDVGAVAFFSGSVMCSPWLCVSLAF
jgi:hypothetical protein